MSDNVQLARWLSWFKAARGMGRDWHTRLMVLTFMAQKLGWCRTLKSHPLFGRADVPRPADEEEGEEEPLEELDAEAAVAAAAAGGGAVGSADPARGPGHPEPEALAVL